jgi:hypothetical protein
LAVIIFPTPVSVDVYSTGAPLLFLTSSTSSRGALPKKSAPEDNEAPETTKRRDEDEFDDSSERTESSQSLPLIRLKRIYNFLCSMLVFTPFA